MQRYLLNVAYIGTMFKGVQRNTNWKTQITDPKSVQGQIEIALKNLRTINQPLVVCSSRTDSGVHALHTTFHVDLESVNGKYNPESITIVLNKFFCKAGIAIRILKTYIVPKSFHCRFNALSRTYLYRLGIMNKPNSAGYLTHLPIEECNRCYFVCTDSFDVHKAQEAAKLFVGHHDFRSFMNKSSHYPNKNTRRTISKFEISDTNITCYSTYSWPYCVKDDILESQYKFYDITIKSQGFLYRQVRRSVASLIAVAQGIISTRDIKFMLEVPSHNSWNPRIKPAPAHGLYLCEVAYSQSDAETFLDKLED